MLFCLIVFPYNRFLIGLFQGGPLLHHPPVEGRSAFLYHRPHWIWVGIHQAHPHRQRKEGLHDHTSPTGTM